VPPRRKSPDSFAAGTQATLEDFCPRSDAELESESNRYEVWKELDRLRESVWKWLTQGDSYGEDYAKIIGLIVNDHEAPRTVYRKGAETTLEIHSARPTLRRTVDGSVRTDLVIEATQRRRGYFDKAKQAEMDARQPHEAVDEPDFKFRAGCTILIDPKTAEVRRIIRTPGNIASNEELERGTTILGWRSRNDWQCV
jgi:hypothetical protein